MSMASFLGGGSLTNPIGERNRRNSLSYSYTATSGGPAMEKQRTDRLFKVLKL